MAWVSQSTLTSSLEFTRLASFDPGDGTVAFQFVCATNQGTTFPVASTTFAAVSSRLTL